VLEDAGIATQVFAAQELSLPGMAGHSAGGLVSNVLPMDPTTWRLRVPGQVAVTAADVRFSAMARWRSLQQGIDQYDPDAVLFVGFFSPLVWTLRQRYPVLGMSLHTLPPVAPVDLWLSANPQPQARMDWPGLPQPAARHFPFRFWPVDLPAAARSEIGVRENAVLLVTCGARLDPDGLAGWIAEVVRFLDEEPRAEWLVVGPDASQGARLGQKHPRIRVLPQRTDLTRWVALGDLYLNPPRIGGGASVAMAMEAGVPVVSLAGGDGGDKIGSLAIQNTGDYRRRLAEWVGDSVSRAQAGAHLKAKFREELDLSSPAAARALVQACEEAGQCFARRQASPLPGNGARP
jgi:glycosyltransferase involved in cell wall biosynthesis